jgi:transketolase
MTKIASSREAFTAGMLDLAAQDRRVVLVSADSVKALRATPFEERYPDRLFEVGIAEQNAVGLAAGMASCGLIPYVATYAGFITMRACEQMRTFVAYPHLNVKMVGLNGGIFCGEREGVTHQFFEDLGIVRSIPGIAIVVPGDASQVRKATRAIAQVDGPVYLRIGSGREPVVFDDDTPFEFGKARVLAEKGTDVAMFANGFVLGRVLSAADMLQQQGVNATVVEGHTLKPLDVSTIVEVLEKTGAAVTVEDHNVIGGLGSAIAEVIAEHMPTPLVRVGLQDVFPESGEAEALLDCYGMDVPSIAEAAMQAIGKKTTYQKGKKAAHETQSI